MQGLGSKRKIKTTPIVLWEKKNNEIPKEKYLKVIEIPSIHTKKKTKD